MLRKIIMIVFLGTLVAAQAKVSPYISVSGGPATMPNLEEKDSGVKLGTYDMKLGFNGEGAVGLAMEPFRLELAGMYQESRADSFRQVDGSKVDASGKIKVESAMLNGYIDLAPSEKFGADSLVPYLLAGAGGARVKSDTIGNSYENSFAYQFGCGAGYYVTDHVIVDLRYKYYVTDYKDDVLGHSLDIRSHLVQLGLRCQF